MRSTAEFRFICLTFGRDVTFTSIEFHYAKPLIFSQLAAQQVSPLDHFERRG